MLPSPAKPTTAMCWMQRLRRVFAIDISTCPRCGGKVRVIAAITQPAPITRILEHRAAVDAPGASWYRAVFEGDRITGTARQVDAVESRDADGQLLALIGSQVAYCDRRGQPVGNAASTLARVPDGARAPAFHARSTPTLIRKFYPSGERSWMSFGADPREFIPRRCSLGRRFPNWFEVHSRSATWCVGMRRQVRPTGLVR